MARTADVGLDDGHAVGGERAGLVGADRRRVAHRLTCVQVPHQVVVMHHLLLTPPDNSHRNGRPVSLHAQYLPLC